MKVKIKDKNFDIEIKDKKIFVDGKVADADLSKISERKYNLLLNSKSYNAEIISHDKNEKIIVVKVNGKKIEMKISDRYDELLHQLGFDKKIKKGNNDIKAPMPGMVLKLAVEVGMQVKKGDTLLILEAMKMENNIKSPTDGIIKNIAVAEKEKVEKNQPLIYIE